MRIAFVITGCLLALPAGHLGAEERPSSMPFEVGQRIEVTIADEYQAEGVSVRPDRSEFQGRTVRRDKKTFMVTSLDGTQIVRYPVSAVVLTGTVVAIDEGWLILDLGDGRPHVRVPWPAIIESNAFIRPRTGDPCLTPGAWERAALPAGRIGAEERPSSTPFEVGQRIEATIAYRYQAEGISVRPDRLEVQGRTVRRDKKTITVSSLDGTQALRYPAAGAVLTGKVVAFDESGLALDLMDGRPHVRIPNSAIVDLKVCGLLGEADGSLRRGARVRLRSSDLGGKSATGRILEINDQSLLLKLPDHVNPVALRRSSISQMEVSLGARTGKKTGVTIGASVIGALGAAFGAFAGAAVEGGAPLKGAAGCALIGALAGGLMGGLVGDTIETERWQAIPPTQISASIAPRPRGGVTASLSIRF